MPDRQITWRRHHDATQQWEVAETAAAPGLRSEITGYSRYQEQLGASTTRREMPGTQAVLLVNFGNTLHLKGGNGEALSLSAGKGFVAGLHTRPALSRTEQGIASGIHVFLPISSLRRLFRLDMQDLLDRVLPLEDLLGPLAAGLGEALAEASAAQNFDFLDVWLGRRLEAAPPSDRAIDWAIASLNANPTASIESLAREIGWSRQHFHARFRSATGASPRLYARLRRFERLMRCLARGTKPHWADLAAAHGFSDQPHMVREVRDLSGLTPAKLLQRFLPDGGGILEN